MNKTLAKVPQKRFCWVECHYGPAYFPIETHKWPFDEAALWPFLQSLVDKWETSVWGFEGYGIKNTTRGQIIRIHPAVQWTAFQKWVSPSIQQLHNKDTLNYKQMVTMASHQMSQISLLFLCNSEAFWEHSNNYSPGKKRSSRCQ